MNGVKEMRVEGQMYYKKKVLNEETQRLNTVLICGEPACRREFNKKCNLIDHLRIHSGLKPHMCPICRKGFKQRAQLYKHKTTHLSGADDDTDLVLKKKPAIVWVYKFIFYRSRTTL